ncbi:MAG: hypothetical protein ACI4AK_01655 [Lepagella sp.]
MWVLEEDFDKNGTDWHSEAQNGTNIYFTDFQGIKLILTKILVSR